MFKILMQKRIKLLNLAIIFCAFIVVPVSVQAQLDDPTRPPGHRLALPGGKRVGTNKVTFILSSVYISSSRRSAVINDRKVELGSSVNGAKVIEITPSAVKLKRRGKFFTVRLLSQVVKKTRRQ